MQRVHSSSCLRPRCTSGLTPCHVFGAGSLIKGSRAVVRSSTSSGLSLHTNRVADGAVLPGKVHDIDIERRQNEVTDQPAVPFKWTARWWPIHGVASLDRKIPLHVDLLGMSLVVWADTKGSWHCLMDRCPHRLAPLSEGRVEPQGLMCCYHGWTFDGNGSCTSIPQMAPDAEAAACSSKRACVKSYPTMVAHGLLWVWPEAGQTEAAQAAAPDLQRSLQMAGAVSWLVRDLPVRWDELVENVIDPSHIDHAHHGLQGNRYSNPIGKAWRGMKITQVQPEGYEATTRTEYAKMKLEFKPPNLVRYTTQGPIGQEAIVLLVPTKPGWSRIFTTTRMTAGSLPWRTSLVKYVKNNLLPWWGHITDRNGALDGDTFLLHLTERQIMPSRGLGMKSLSHAYYMPASTDTSVVAFRKWIQKYAGPIPTCRLEDEAAMPSVMTREQALDRYEQHVKHCAHCKKALGMTDSAILGTRTVGALATAVAITDVVVTYALTQVQPSSAINTAALPATNSFWQTMQACGLLAPLLVSFVLILAAWTLHNNLTKLRRKFFYEEYVHALKD